MSHLVVVLLKVKDRCGCFSLFFSFFLFSFAKYIPLGRTISFSKSSSSMNDDEEMLHEMDKPN
jgi:hypothetical protein